MQPFNDLPFIFTAGDHSLYRCEPITTNGNRIILKVKDELGGNPKNCDKVVKVVFAGTGADIALSRETWILASLRLSVMADSRLTVPFPRLIAPFEYRSAGQFRYTAMEYINGPILKDWAQALEVHLPGKQDATDRVMRPHLVYYLGKKLLEGLKKIHDAGWVHMDLHYGNVIIRPDATGRWDEDYDVVLIDFGFARRWKRTRADENVMLPDVERITEVERKCMPRGQAAYYATSALGIKEYADPVDDLESLGYLLASMAYNMALPWDRPGLGAFEITSERLDTDSNYDGLKYWENRMMPPEYTDPTFTFTHLAEYIHRARETNPRAAKSAPRTQEEYDRVYKELYHHLDVGFAEADSNERAIRNHQETIDAATTARSRGRCGPKRVRKSSGSIIVTGIVIEMDGKISYV